MTAIVPTLTAAGLDALINAQGDGVEARISHVAFGDGDGAVYTPAGTETALRREQLRVPISGGQKTGPATLQVEAVLDGPTPFVIREIGFVLDDGTLLALWSNPDGPSVSFAPGFSIAFGFTLMFVGVPADVVNVTVNAPSLNFTVTGPIIQISAEVIRAHRLGITAERQRATPVIESMWR